MTITTPAEIVALVDAITSNESLTHDERFNLLSDLRDLSQAAMEQSIHARFGVSLGKKKKGA